MTKEKTRLVQLFCNILVDLFDNIRAEAVDEILQKWFQKWLQLAANSVSFVTIPDNLPNAL